MSDMVLQMPCLQALYPLPSVRDTSWRHDNEPGQQGKSFSMLFIDANYSIYLGTKGVYEPAPAPVAVTRRTTYHVATQWPVSSL